MAKSTDCFDCGAPNAFRWREDTDPSTGACCDVWLCDECADLRAGKKLTVDEQNLAHDGDGRR